MIVENAAVVPAAPDSLRHRARRTVEAGCAHLAARQTARGSWDGDYGGPMFLLPMYVAVAHFAGHELAADTRKAMLRSLLHAQNEDGSVGVYEGGPGCVFTSSLAYAALRLLGAAADDPAGVRMATWIRAHGTPICAASWGKLTLALIDLYDYEGLDPISPELWLLPYALPVHPGRLWCHARQVYLPMAYLYGTRAKRPANDLVCAIREELYGDAWARVDWHAARRTVSPTDVYRPSTPWLQLVNRVLGAYERVTHAGLRRRALEETFSQIAYEDEVTNFIRIGPVNAVLNTAVHAARTPGGPAVARSFEALESYLWRGPEGLTMQGYNSSELWDTAFAVRSVLAALAATVPDHRGEWVRASSEATRVPAKPAQFRCPSAPTAARIRGSSASRDAERQAPAEACSCAGLAGLSLVAAARPSCLHSTSWDGSSSREGHRELLVRAHDYLRDNQILADVPDAERHYRHRSRGGWPFSNRAHGWPITDCTAEALTCALALEREVDHPVDEPMLRAAVELLFTFQNDDGGFGTYERQRAGHWLEALNPSQVFGDIMVDTSFTECTSAVVQALGEAKKRFPGDYDARIDGVTRSAERFLREKQDASGGWEGSWGVCFTYGTWFGVSGLLAAGASPADPAIAHACSFLLDRQNADGSWGERPESCSQHRYIAHERGQVVMTSWALSTLVRARHVDRDAQDRAARFLVERQEPDGSWACESIAGVFNRTCMINYDNYRLYFPVWALAEWLALSE